VTTDVENELLRLRHELELTRKELGAAVELHERAGTMIAEALGRHALTHQVGWLYEDYAADIRHLVERGDWLAVMEARLSAAREKYVADVAAGWETGTEAGELRAALVTALADVKGGIESNEKLLAELAAERSRVDALVAALPKCVRCSESATRLLRNKGCDEHGEAVGAMFEDYPHAAPLRAILAARKAVP
jgi:hypothetical protein